MAEDSSGLTRRTALPLGTPARARACGRRLAVALLLFPLLASGLRADKPPPTRQDQAWTAAERLFSRRRWPQAENAYLEFRRDFGVDERALEALYRIGVCRHGRGERGGALAAWREAVQSPANRPSERAVMPQILGALFEALDPGRDRHERDRILNRLAREYPADTSVSLRLHVAEGRRRFEAFDMPGAVRALGAVEAQLEASDRDLLEIARAHAGRGALDPALIMRLADRRLENDAPEAAAVLYAMALEARPTPLQEREIRVKLGWALYLMSQLDDAERHWRSVVAHAPQGDFWRGRGRWHLAVLHAGYKRDVRTAIALCEEQATEFAGHLMGEQALFAHAWLLMVTEKWQPALETFQRLVAAYPRTANNVHVRNYILRCEQALGKKKK